VRGILTTAFLNNLYIEESNPSPYPLPKGEE